LAVRCSRQARIRWRTAKVLEQKLP